MQYLSTAFLVTAIVIVVHQDGVSAQLIETYDKVDQVAVEAKNRAVTIIDGPKLVTTAQSPPPASAVVNTTHKPEQRPPSKPPINLTPDKHGKTKYEVPRLYYGQIQNFPPLRQPYNRPLKIQQPNSAYKYHKVIPMQPVRSHYPQKQTQLIFAASTSKPSIHIPKHTKFNLPVETINGINADFVRPPHFINSTSSTSTTTAATTTTAKYLRTKRIWPKHILDKMNALSSKSNITSNNTSEDLNTSASHRRYVYYVNRTVSTTEKPSTTRGSYRPVTRVPKKRTTTSAPANYTRFEPNDWVPIVPSHYPINKVRKVRQKLSNRRSDIFYYDEAPKNSNSNYHKRMIYLQSFGLVPMASAQNPSAIDRKNIIVIGKKKPLLSNVSGYKKKPVQTSHVIREYPFDASDPKIITKIKHHHHHHHHRYVKTVEKPVRVEVPKPVPVAVPMPVPVKVETRVPYPVPVKVPHPVPVKVVEKEYVPKPYPVIQHIPVIRQVPVEKKVPYPVEVKVPYEKRVPVPVPYEKKVPVPVPVKVLVPQPYPVETKVPCPVTEPVEVIKHVPVKVPYPQPYPVRVPVKVPVPVEKKVPYPVEVEKKVPVPVPFRVTVPEKVEVEKKVPVYIPKPYPVEKKVPVPVKVPYPVRVPIKVPYGVPILVHPSSQNNEQIVSSAVAVDDGNQNHHSHYSYSVHGNTVTSNSVTDVPQHSVTVHGNGVTSNPQYSTVTFHGNTGFPGFQSRSDFRVFDDSTTSNPVTTADAANIDPQTSTTLESPGSELQSLSVDVTTPKLNPR